MIYETFRPRSGPDGNFCTPVQAALLRLPFRGFITTNYDPGLLEARRVMRPDIASTSYSTWMDQDAVLRWASGDVFKDETCPVFFAHGSHERSQTIVLTSDDYHRAYDSGAYRRLFDMLWTRESMVFVGFGFSDPWFGFLSGAVIRELAHCRAGSSRHIAVLGMRPGEKYSADHRRRFQLEYNCAVYYYKVKKTPSGGEDHSDLLHLLESLREGKSAAQADAPGARAISSASPSPLKQLPPHVIASSRTPLDGESQATPVLRWLHETTDDDRYVGRSDDLRRLDAWAADPSVRVIALTGLGGLGKTSLVGHWLKHHKGICRRPVRGLLFWSFYADRSVESFFDALRALAADELGFREATGALPVDMAIDVMSSVPLFIILDGLEVLQEGPGTECYGSLVDLALRQFLVAGCQTRHRGLLILTSRFPLRDLAQNFGRSHRAVALDRLLDEEGASLLAKCDVEGTHNARMQVSRRLEGHPLAIRVFAAALATQADRDPTRLLNVLFDKASMDATVPLQGKLSRLLSFYEKHMPVHRKALMRLISLFRSPIDQDTLKKLARRLARTRHLFGEMPDPLWRSHLLDLRNEHLILRDLSEDDEERFSCHPILRDHFRASMLTSDKTAAPGVADLLAGQPASERPSNLHEIEPVLSAIELLQQAGNFKRADELYQERLKNGYVFRFLPAPHEGLNCAFGFVADLPRQNRCSRQLGKSRLSYYLNAVGLHGAFAGELKLAVMFYNMADKVKRNELQLDKTISGQQNKSWALAQLGQLSEALDIAYEAVLGSNQLSNTEARIRSYVHYAYILLMRGDVNEAEGYFESAEELQRSSDRKRRNLVGSADIWWSEMLIRVGEIARARRRLEANVLLCDQNGWVDDLARCHFLIGRIALHEGDDKRAEEFLNKAEIAMRKAHMMTELPQVLLSIAVIRKRQQTWEDALLLAEESLELSRLRGMLPSHADSLILRARLMFDRARATLTPESETFDFSIQMARDDAQTGLEISRNSGYAWAERDALELLAEISTVLNDVRTRDDYRSRARVLDKHLTLKTRPERKPQANSASTDG